MDDQQDVHAEDADDDEDRTNEIPEALLASAEGEGEYSQERKQDSKRKRDNPGLLRKAPGAPKRFKSSYICFFMAKQSEIKAELGDNATVMTVSKRSGEMWKELTREQRAHWDEVAAKDKQRYMAEKSTYTGPWQVPWKRARKDPSAPKRPMSAFLMFAQNRRAELRRKNPAMKNTEVSQILGEMWRNMSDDERQPFVAQEESERAVYKTKFAEWRAETEARAEAERRAQAELQLTFPAYTPASDPSMHGLPPVMYPPDNYGQPPYVPGAPYPCTCLSRLSTPRRMPSRSSSWLSRSIYAMCYVDFPAYAPYLPSYPPHQGKRPIVLAPSGLPRYPIAPYPHSQPAQAPVPAQESNSLGAEGNPFGPAHHYDADHSHDALSAFEPNPVVDDDGQSVE